jgi:hypothetical protein
MDETQARDTGRLATAVGLVAIGSIVCLGTYFAVGGPFGTISDIGNATTGVLSGALAWQLRSRIPRRPGPVAVSAAIAGAAATVAGSGLVISGTTGFFLAGLVSSVGFAGIGAWLVALNGSSGDGVALPVRLRRLGMIAGGLMALGVVAVPGILLRLDDMDTAPAWTWVAMAGWLGTYVVYPAWALWFGAVESRRSSQQLTSLPSDRSTNPDEARSWVASKEEA